MNDLRRAFWGTSAEELATLNQAHADGITFADLIEAYTGGGGGGADLGTPEQDEWGAVLAYGPTNGANEKWQFDCSGGNTITGGTFTISWDGANVGGPGTTAPIAHDANADVILAAIRDGLGWDDELRMTQGGAVWGWWNNSFVIEFVGGSGLWNIDVTFTADGANLTGSEAPYTLTTTKLSDGFEPDEYGYYWAQDSQDPGTLAVLAAATVEIYGGLDPNQSTGIYMSSQSGIFGYSNNEDGVFFRCNNSGWFGTQVYDGGSVSLIAVDGGGDVYLGALTGTVNLQDSVGTLTLDDIRTGIAGGIVTANRQTANYVLVLGDRGKVIEMNLAGANTLTVPPNSSVAFPIGVIIEGVQWGAGQTTITPGSGVTIRSSGGKLKTNAQYASFSLRKVATDEWHATGELAA